MNAMRLRADRTEAEAGLTTATLPQPDGAETSGSEEGGNVPASATTSAPGSDAASAPASASLTDRALRAAGTAAADLAVRGANAAARKLGEQAAKPDSVLYAIKHARPTSIATHHGGIGEMPNWAVQIQMHTAGRALKIAGTALSALGDNYVAQLIVLGVVVFNALVFAFGVF